MKVKKKFMLLLVAILCITWAMPLHASVSLPSISSGRPVKCYTLKSSGRIYAYTAANLRNRTGGYIDCASDECSILRISGNAVQVKYPVSRGTRTAWFARNEFSSCNLANGAAERWTQNSRITTYRRADGRDSYGYISSGDTCYKLSESGNYKQVVYPVSGGYKMGWIRKSDSEKGVPSGSKRVKLSYALYQNSGARLSCGFDGYTNTSGRHEGIDFTYRTGEPVYALTSGVVTAVRKGRTGGNGLSTFAVYNSDDNKTVVYLHMSIGSFSVGDTIRVGQRIGTQSWRGISSSSSAHTHVEVRNGRKTAAAVSVGDRRLDNQNPKQYWESKGYSIG